ncbi:uncharacterized protein [Arachis hypogaea]|uniref:uncharacterized protein isoform X3 n=1 Tax=Arachis hypogaea TaxID=3818 RepID=UPI003B21117E
MHHIEGRSAQIGALLLGLKYCGICCQECKCVPSGTYGNKHECPCYRDKPNDWCWVNTNLGVEDLDSSMERLSLSIMSQEKSAAANSVDPREYTLTPFTLEEASSEHGNQNVMNNYNNGAIVQGALLTSSHDYNGFNSIEQETHDVGESVAQRLQGIRGHVVTLARDQYGCRFLQAMIDDGIPQEIDMILDEVEDHTHELMTHHFAARAYLHERPRVSSM